MIVLAGTPAAPTRSAEHDERNPARPSFEQLAEHDERNPAQPSFEQLVADAEAEPPQGVLGSTHDTRTRLEERAIAPVTTPTGFDLTRPVPGEVGSPFGPRTHPVLGHVLVHPGIDLSVPAGTPVFSAGPGVIGRGEAAGAYGRLVVVDHGDDVATWYAHLSSIEHGPGTPVRRGDLIGRVGETGQVTGPHLHFELRVGGVPVDPAPWLVGPAS